MISLYMAELQKTVGNRWVTGFLLWIFPVGALGVVLFVALLALLIDDFGVRFFNETPLWTTTMIGVWGFPTNTLGQMFLIGFTAVTFAGEYQWDTWKNILPRQRRAALIGAKFATMGTLVVFTFLLMSVIMGLGYGLIALISDLPYGPALSAQVLADFGRDFGLQMVLTLLSVLITAVYAAFTAMLMRSILGGVLVGLALVIVEPVFAFILAPLARMLEAPNLLKLVRFTPTYNVDNIRSWVTNDTPSQMLAWMQEMVQTTIPSDGIAFSLLVLTAWVVVGIGLIIGLFNRQDIV